MNFKRDGIAPNAGRLLWAGFFAILAAGVGFGIRTGIIDTWRREFGFTDEQIGSINGAMFSGFCFAIITGGLVCDRLGYGKLVIAAFLFHLISAVSALGASADNTDLAFQLMFWGTFVFGLANGTLEAVANPLVATLFPSNRTHYLNILHASWPAGLVLGGFAGWWIGDAWPWKAQLALFLIPTLFYGALFLGQHTPMSEAKQKGLSFAEMFKDVGMLGGLIVCVLLSQFFLGSLGFGAGLGYGIAGSLLIVVGVLTRFSPGAWLLFTLFVAHMLIGAVELGTDSWISNITGNFLTPDQGKILFVFTSAIMFSLRFCADFIEKRLGLSPVGILLTCAVLACVGLNLAAGIETFYGAMLALAVYAVGKTFFWPTMLAVASDRFPRTGAIAISMMGGIGMLSAGVLGGPGLGYAKDRFAGAELRAADAAVYASNESPTPSRFLMFAEVKGIDGKKLGAVQEKLGKLRKDLATTGVTDPKAALDKLAPDERKLIEASIAGDRQTLRADSVIPAVMAAIYLLLALYFKSIGGYRALRIDEPAK